ncbi:TetR/AcrR family transcriptional regulator [Hyphomonas pacifica]|nr:TetR/AcrR family transcriptional regulator [Hyphomonas pacifica]
MITSIRLFSRYGYDGTSTTAVARESGVSQPTIHYHFSDKMTLWKRAMRRMLRDMMKENPYTEKILCEKDPVKRLRLRMIALMEAVRVHKAFGRVVMLEGISGGARLNWLIKEALSPFYEQFVVDIQECQASGRIKKVEISKLVIIMHSVATMYHNIAPLVREAFNEDPSDMEETERYQKLALDIVFKGLAPD